MPLTEELVVNALRRVGAQGGTDVVAGGVLAGARLSGDSCAVQLRAVEGMGRDAMDELAGLAFASVLRACREAKSPLVSFDVEFISPTGDVTHRAAFAPPGPSAGAPPGHRPIPGLADSPGRAPAPGGGLPGVARIIAVGAGKGGVGKSTVAVNLAVGLARRGRAVGLLDGDIYGPSLPTLMGLGSLETAALAGKLQPFLVHDVKTMTIGKLVDADKPLIWRGPMAHGAFKQLAEQTAWGELDWLVIDLPPGTGDVPLTMAQVLRLTGAVVVCTPQKVAQDDAVRAARMFQQLGIEVLGVVENMSYFIGDDGREYDIFGRGGAAQMARRLGLPFLGEIPISMPLRRNSDAGDPASNFNGGGALAAALVAMVDGVEAQAALAAVRTGAARPTLSIS